MSTNIISFLDKNHLEDEVINLRHIIALMPGNVYWKNKHGVYMGCNENMAELLGLSSQEAIIGKTVFDLLSDKQLDIAQSTHRNDLAIMTQKKEQVLEETGLDLSGNPATYFTRKKPLFNRIGEVIGLLGISIDITERKQKEKELEQAKSEAELANRIKSDFIRNIEHDIRTPFSGVLGLTSVLRDSEQNPEKKGLLDDIYQCANELLNYCNKILDFSQVEQNAIPILDKKIKLLALLNKVIDIETPAAKAKQLILSIDVDNTLPKTVRGDDHRLFQILINLVSNAIKFTHQGTVKITVKKLKQTGKKVITQFIIEDTGIGMSTEKQYLIYEKFVRLTASNTGIYKGAGLGLHIVKQYIHEMNGEIDLYSKPNTGSTFIVTLPFNLPLSEHI
jgi:two-component system aerobic respiration control sensor histidine kinase ArcB